MSLHKRLTAPVSRLAPTPSGLLHIGNAYSFVLTALIVKFYKGTLHLRIDDIDTERSRPEYLEDIFSQLEWLGISYDVGPSGVEDFKKNYSQHLRLEKYSQAISKLQNLFACQCSRSQVAALAALSVYPGTCRDLKRDMNNTEFQLRFNTQSLPPTDFHDLCLGNHRVDLKNQMGDFVVRRKGGQPAYQIVSCLEDITDQITLIVRGEDLLNSTAAQIELSKQLGSDLSKTTEFLHHPLLSENDQTKLSKSHDSLSLQKMRESGVKKTQVYQYLAKLFGFKNTMTNSLEEMLEEFQYSELSLKSEIGIKI